jgi:small subunit ribosomal protein S8
MGMTDPISDLLTRIRNAIAMQHETVLVPVSNLKLRIVYVLETEGFIRTFKIVKGDQVDQISIYLKYAEDQTPAITALKRISRPGRRVYVKSSALPRVRSTVRNGLGIAVISTSQGVMTDLQAEKSGLGGEHICSVW